MSKLGKFTFYDPIFSTETKINSMVLSSNIIGANKPLAVNMTRRMLGLKRREILILVDDELETRSYQEGEGETYL